MSKIVFSLEEGLSIQAEQLAVWKAKLVPELYNDLVVHANKYKENWSDGYDVRRGTTLDEFIANWKPFNLVDELDEFAKGLDGDEINGLIFVGPLVDNGGWMLSFPSSVITHQDVNIFVTPFLEKYLFDGIDFRIGDEVRHMPCARPTTYEEFEKWKKFYIGQLVTVQGKFASVDKCEVDMDNKTYTVEGFLVPRQTISYSDFSDWGSLVDFNGLPIVDCQIDFDEEVTFQYVDYNFVMDAEEGEGDINLDDTLQWGKGSYTHRDYRECKVSLTHDVKDHGIDKLIEIRSFKVNRIFYEVHIDATHGREIFEIHCENGKDISEEIRNILEHAVTKIDN